MSYLVFARKWRPQTFSEVIGQKHVTKTLQNAISSERIGHAFLLTGSRGVGKTSVARILAKALNCKDGPAIEPCNQCPACTGITNGSSVDVLEIDGASNTGVDDVRELRENARYLPAQSRRKIYIIDEVHMLSNNAFNALLKTLEEPPAHVVFIFATTEPHKIPETILSRCQRFDFRRIPLQEILNQLKKVVQKEGVQISEQSLLVLCREAEGSMRDAQSLLDQVISFGGLEVSDKDVIEVLGVIDRKWLFSTSKAIIKRDSKQCLEIVENIYRFGYSIEHFYQNLLEHFRDLVIAKLGGDVSSLLNLPDNEIEALVELANEVSLEDLQNWFDLLIRSDEEIRRASFPKMVMEMVLVKMANFPSTRSIRDVLLGIEELEQRIERIAGKPTSKGELQAIEDEEEARLPVVENQELEQRIERIADEPAGKGELQVIDEEEARLPVVENQEPEKEPEAKDDNASEGSLDVFWNDLLEHFRTQNPLFAAVLEDGEPVLKGEGKLEISFQNSFCMEKAKNAEFQRAVDRFCQDFFNREIELSFILREGKGNSSKGVSKGHGNRSMANERERIEEDIRRHPVVQQAIEILRGKIVEVRVN
jgi:DNA polymerase-3 subunit gamma/tau